MAGWLQAVEPSTLVPLAHGAAKQVYLVGDPVQLPATVMSQRALKYGYDSSLFKRLQAAGYPVQVRAGDSRLPTRAAATQCEPLMRCGLSEGSGCIPADGLLMEC